jgi:hypothetical protein
MKMKPISKINMESSYLISMKNLRMSKKMKSFISRKINFMKMKPISKVSPYIFITMNALVYISSISMLLLPRENKNIMKVILFLLIASGQQ